MPSSLGSLRSGNGFVLGFHALAGQSFAALIVVPTRGRRNGRASVPTRSGGGALAFVGPQRVGRELHAVAFAQEHGKRALAITRIARRVGEAPTQQLERALELLLPAVTGERPVDELSIDTGFAEPPHDPLHAH